MPSMFARRPREQRRRRCPGSSASCYDKKLVIGVGVRQDDGRQRRYVADGASGQTHARHAARQPPARHRRGLDGSRSPGRWPPSPRFSDELIARLEAYAARATAREETPMGQTLYDKVFDAHTVRRLPSGQYQLLMGLHLIHEVTSPQAFSMLRERGLRRCSIPERTFATVDHIIPTHDQRAPARRPAGRGDAAAPRAQLRRVRHPLLRPGAAASRASCT